MDYFYLVLIILLGLDQFMAIDNLTDPDWIIDDDVEERQNIALRKYYGSDIRKMIFPGTKWCGPGNNAKDDNDFGKLKAIDKCCYVHDHCDELLPGESKYGLTNTYSLAKLHCSCDKDLFDCLRNEGSKTAHFIAGLYGVGQPKCFKEDHPIVKCNRYQKRFFVRRCVDYSVDTTQPKKYQFFDLPFYSQAKSFTRKV